MTAQEIKNEVKRLVNSDSAEYKAMYTEIVDENQNCTFYTFSGLLESVYEGIEEMGYEENEWSEYPTLSKSSLEDIYHQVK